ncbi:uncharacterized protein LOC144920807 [Branchiostoma floridae x Branchiostoma belcheri]
MMLRLCAVLVLAVLPATVLGLSADEKAAFVTRVHTETNTGLQGTVFVWQDGDTLVLKSNGIPDHETGTFPGLISPIPLQVQDFEFRIPATPTPAASPGCLYNGMIGMAANGIPIVDPFNDDFLIPCLPIISYLDEPMTDSCGGRPSNVGAYYHYTHYASCVAEYDDTVVGVAFDGFPIYGRLRRENGTMYVHDDLDACNGITVNGTYRYHMTVDFPYFIGCFHGELLANNSFWPYGWPIARANCTPGCT